MVWSNIGPDSSTISIYMYMLLYVVAVWIYGHRNNNMAWNRAYFGYIWVYLINIHAHTGLILIYA